MAILNYHQFGGKYSETAALRNVLAYTGVKNPHTGEPFSEAMLLGIGGGIGAGYIMYEFGPVPSVYLETHWHGNNGVFLRQLIARLGLEAEVNETAGSKGASKHLADALAQGRPAIAALDRASLQYQGYPSSRIKYMEHTAVVFGLDEEAGLAYMGDKAANPLTVASAELAASRAAITNQRNRLVTIVGGEVTNLEQAIVEGIQACIKGMCEPEIANFGLKALSKWAAMLTNQKDKKSWPKLLPPGRGLYNALSGIYRQIETYDTPGSAFRAMYAEFLDEASTAANRPALADVATQYRQLAKSWSAIAESALPDEVAQFAETKRLLQQRNKLSVEQGVDAIAQMRECEASLSAIGEEMADNFPLSPTEVADLEQRLSEQVLALHEGEGAAIEALSQAVALPANLSLSTISHLRITTHYYGLPTSLPCPQTYCHSAPQGRA